MITLTRTPEISVSFSASELAQLEAFATLHGVSVTAFIQKAALEAAHVSARQKSAPVDASWLSDTPSSAPKTKVATELFAVNDEEDEVESAEAAPLQASTPINAPAAPRRGVVGEPSKLAKGTGPVWEIRRALGNERVHGLGWTREHLAFVLKLSVVGVRKMERLGTSPLKSLEARRALLKLAKTLKNPTPSIETFIAAEAAEIGDRSAN